MTIDTRPRHNAAMRAAVLYIRGVKDTLLAISIILNIVFFNTYGASMTALTMPSAEIAALSAVLED